MPRTDWVLLRWKDGTLSVQPIADLKPGALVIPKDGRNHYFKYSGTQANTIRAVVRSTLRTRTRARTVLSTAWRA
jgi:hypothetical protein